MGGALKIGYALTGYFQAKPVYRFRSLNGQCRFRVLFRSFEMSVPLLLSP